MTSADWSMSIASGGRPLWLPSPAGSTTTFSADGRYAIVLMSHQIRVYFVNTRQCIRTINVNLVGAVDAYLDPTNASQILIFRADGDLVVVNWRDKVSQPIVAQHRLPTALVLAVVTVSETELVLVTGKRERGLALASAHTRHIVKVDRNLFDTTPVVEVPNVIKFAVSTDRTKLCFVTATHECVLVGLLGETDDDRMYTSETLPFAYRSIITALAVSNDNVVAIGTMAGAIQIVYGDIGEVAKPQRLLKWHIDQVRSLLFTPDNNYLMSGGLERVLVFWQLETDKTQFLPRLNGSIDRISVDLHKPDYYTLMLKVPVTTNTPRKKDVDEEDEDEACYEVLVVSAVDLVLRLLVNGVRPEFTNPNVRGTLGKTKKRFAKLNNFDRSKLRHDYTAVFEVHPRTQQLYFPRGATIQCYDLTRNEQAFTQDVAPLLSTGKVRLEQKLIDPKVSILTFSDDGQWMCTFDTITTSEVDNLLSKDDLQYALKFWKYVDTPEDTAAGHWELSTKIIDPHGPAKPVLAAVGAPQAYHDGAAFLTVDNKGGLRIWRPRVPKEIYQKVKQANNKLQQTAWTLRKSYPSGALVSNAVSACWSDDGLLLFVGHECTINVFNIHTLEEISHYTVPAMAGSRIRSLSIMGQFLVVLSKTSIVSFDLLTGNFTPLAAKINTTVGGKNLIAVDKTQQLICVAANYYCEDDSRLAIKAKIMVFRPDRLQPVYVAHHDQGVASIRVLGSLFVFVDLYSRVGLVASSSAGTADALEVASDMQKVLLSAHAKADLINSRAVAVATPKHTLANGAIDESEISKVVDLHSFQPIFENLEGVQIETLFSKIMNILK